MRNIDKRKVIYSLAMTLTCLGTMHGLVLSLAYIRFQKIEFFNYFYILDLGLLFPGIDKGILSLIVSYAFFALIFLIIYSLFTRPGK